MPSSSSTVAISGGISSLPVISSSTGLICSRRLTRSRCSSVVVFFAVPPTFFRARREAIVGRQAGGGAVLDRQKVVQRLRPKRDQELIFDLAIAERRQHAEVHALEGVLADGLSLSRKLHGRHGDRALEGGDEPLVIRAQVDHQRGGDRRGLAQPSPPRITLSAAR